MLIPALALSTLREDVALRRIAPGLPPRGIYAAYPSKGYRPPALAPMLDAYRAAAADHLDAVQQILEQRDIA
jgi:DNA-binding transcriptional LysR family regulator